MGSYYLTKLKAFSCVKFYCFKPEMESLGMVGFKVEEVGKKENGEVIKRLRMRIVVEHEDIIRDGFWTAHPYILSVARSKQQQAHPPSPAAKPQLSLSLR